MGRFKQWEVNLRQPVDPIFQYKAFTVHCTLGTLKDIIDVIFIALVVFIITETGSCNLCTYFHIWVDSLFV